MVKHMKGVSEEEVKAEDIDGFSHYLAGLYKGYEYDDLYQTAYLAALEAQEKGINVLSNMTREVHHKASVMSSPVEISRGSYRSGNKERVNNALLPTLEVIPATAITTDTPETILINKESMEKLLAFLEYENLYLTEPQRDSLSVLYFKDMDEQVFCDKYNCKRVTIYHHKDEALKKMKKHMEN